MSAHGTAALLTGGLSSLIRTNSPALNWITGAGANKALGFQKPSGRDEALNRGTTYAPMPPGVGAGATQGMKVPPPEQTFMTQFTGGLGG